MTFPPIEVTQADIDNGTPGECDSCPIALALKRMGCRNIGVHQEFVEFDYGADLQVTGTLPPEAQEFITTFDEDPSAWNDDEGYTEQRGRVKPFTFTLPDGP